MTATRGQALRRRIRHPWARVPRTEKRSGVAAVASAAAKRGLDIVCALIGLVLTAPAWLVLPVLIKLEDGGPVFFVHTRIGRDGETFHPLKFRSMVPDGSGERTPQQDTPDEELITRVGRFMRATALDELPQLWNILRGDMSLVGPRAVPPEERCGQEGERVDVQEVPGYRLRHRIRPGLTGLAQVYLPRSARHRDKFRLDTLYVRRRTLWLDVKLILLSVWISLRGKWPDVGTHE